MKHYTDLLTNLIGEWEKGGAKKKPAHTNRLLISGERRLDIFGLTNVTGQNFTFFKTDDVMSA